MFKIITLSISIIIITRCAAATNTTTHEVSALIQEKNCPLLFHYDNETGQCECLSSLFNTFETSVMCANDRAFLSYTFCLTHNEETNTLSVSYCTYFALDGHNISEPGFINLPKNVTELNDYMCGPMNRKGIVCSECIDGYGPSVTSPNFRCSDCSNAWHGVPLYLLLELVPVTVFYLIILICQVNMTSAPMISFIFYSNIILLYLNLNLINKDQSQTYATFLAVSYGIWSLDFFRYAIPPFCISPHLQIIHALYLQNISTVFPYVLIAFTWLCIKLYSRDYKVITLPWQLLNRVIFKYINVKWNSGRTVVDAFATFFLLSFTNLSLTLFLPLYPQKIHNVNFINLSPSVTIQYYTEPSVNFSKEYLPFAALSIALFLFAVFPPVLLLTLYPFLWFRSLLFKCLPKQSIGPLNIFVEKFNNCYRDGLDGGRDMRSLASLYFIILLLAYVLRSVGATVFSLTALYGGCSLFIANVQPHKKRYMSVIDSLIFANLALFTAAIDRNIYVFPFLRFITGILSLIPAVGLFCFVIYELLKKPLKIVFTSVKQKLLLIKQSLLICFDGHKDDRAQDEEQGNTENCCDEIQLPDRIIHPELYAKAQKNGPTY